MVFGQGSIDDSQAGMTGGKPAHIGEYMNTYKVPVTKVIKTYAYIKCKDAKTAKKMIENKTDVIMVHGKVEKVEPFRLGEVGDDKAT